MCTIEELIKRPEGPYLEFKSRLTSTVKAAKEIIAFANGKGGQIVIGVDDESRRIVGIDFSYNLEEWIANVVTDLIVPRPAYEIEYHTTDNKNIMTINIIEGLEKPYHLKNKTIQEGVYVRVGSTIRLADDNGLRQLLREGRGISFGETVVQNSTIKDIDNNKVEKFQKVRKERLGTTLKKTNRALLENLGLFCRNNNKATVAGLLLFGLEPQKFSQLSKAVIRCSRFRGKTKELIIDQLVIEGTLDQQITEAERFMTRNVRLSGIVKGMLREDRYEFPLEAIREALVNAVIHRAYHLEDESIFFAIFDDRIEVISPGGLPSGVTVGNIHEKQISRNKIIARRMFEMGFCEEWGRGIQLMDKWMDKWGLPRPVYEELDNAFKVTFYGPKFHVSEFDEVQQKIIQIVREKKVIHTRDLLAVFKLSRQTIIKKLQGLVKAGALIQDGKRGKTVSYRLPQQDNPI